MAKAKTKAAPVDKLAHRNGKGAFSKRTAEERAKTTKAGERKTVRVRILEAMRDGKERTASEVQQLIGLGHGLKPTMDEEVERGHLRFAASKDDTNLQHYAITAAGRKSLDKGAVTAGLRAEPKAKPAKKAKPKKAKAKVTKPQLAAAE